MGGIELQSTDKGQAAAGVKKVFRKAAPAPLARRHAAPGHTWCKAMAPRLDCTGCAPSPVSSIHLLPALLLLSAARGFIRDSGSGIQPRAAGGRKGGREGGQQSSGRGRRLLQSPSLERSSRSRRRAIVRSTSATPAAAAAIASHGFSPSLLLLRGSSRGAADDEDAE